MIVAARNAAVVRSEEKADLFRISVLLGRAGRERTLCSRLRERFQEFLALSDPLEPVPVGR